MNNQSLLIGLSVVLAVIILWAIVGRNGHNESVDVGSALKRQATEARDSLQDVTRDIQHSIKKVAE